MNNSLIFKGLQNNDEETIRKVKSAFIAELELSVDKVSQIFDNAPTVIIEGVEDNKLEKFKRILEEAGAVIELKGGKSTSCLAHWLEDEDFEEEETLSSDSSTIEFDNSPLELEGSLFKDDESTKEPEEKIEFEGSGLCFEDDTLNQYENNTLNNNSELNFENDTLNSNSGIHFEDDSSDEESDLTIDFDDDNETISRDAKPLSFDTDSQEELQATAVQPPEPDLTIKMEEAPQKEEPAISVAEKAVEEVKELAPAKENKIDKTQEQPVVQEMQDIKVPELHYHRKRNSVGKVPWDVIIIASVGVILLFIANWFYFRG